MGRRPDSAARPSAATRAPQPRRVGLALLVLVALMLTSGCVKQGITPTGRATHNLFFIILWLALPVFLFVEGMLAVCLIWFRKKKGDESAPYQNYGNNAALLAFFGGPLIIVVVLLGFGESTLQKVDHVDPNPANKITVTGFQWQWTAAYPQGFSVTGKTLKSAMTMELPVDQTTQITLKSNDVMHEFFVPALLFMRNAIPGHPNTFSIHPTKVGSYNGQCAQYCGLWHAQMRFTMKVVSAGDYKAWVNQQVAAVKKAQASTCAPSGSAFTITAKNITWDKKCLSITAGKPFQVTIDNQDAGIAHNFAVWADASLKHQFFVTKDVTGVSKKTFTMPALPAGRYYFQCDIHGPAMSGTLVVTAPGGGTS